MADGRGLLWIYPDADSPSHLATNRELLVQSPCERSSLAPVQEGSQSHKRTEHKSHLPPALCLSFKPQQKGAKSCLDLSLSLLFPTINFNKSQRTVVMSDCFAHSHK
jgi:hypothetical protein